jgi:hypothetical protein
MVYSNRFVMCVLVNGKPVEELANGEVQIPFNTEYVLRFRNKNDRRAVVKFWIDGELVSGNNGYVIPANDFIDIKRHNNRDAAFVLVPLNSGEAVDAGKNGPNYDKQKGVVKAEFTLEKKYEPVREIHHYHHPRPRIHKFVPDPFPPLYNPYDPYRSISHNSLESPGAPMDHYSAGGATMDCCMMGDQSREVTYASDDVATFKRISTSNARRIVPQSTVQDGCTVEGNMTGQTFGSVYVDLESVSTTLQIFLRGYDIGKSFPTLRNPCEPIRIPNNDLQIENELLKLKLEEAKRKANEESIRYAEEARLREENERLRRELEQYTS